MSDEQRVPDDSVNEANEVLGKLQGIEESINRIEQSKRIKTLVSVGGVIIVLLILALFGWNLYQFGQKAMSPEVKAEFMSEASEDIVEVARDNPDVQKMVKDLQEDVIPYVIVQISEKFQENMPQFQKEEEKIIGNIQHYLENDVKDKLAVALIEMLVELEQEILKKYPEVSPDEMKPVLEKAQEIFITEITASIEKRLDDMFLSLGELSETIRQFGQLEEAKKLNPKNIEEVKLQMIEAMLELVIYHLNPERGDAPAVVAAGGVK